MVSFSSVRRFGIALGIFATIFMHTDASATPLPRGNIVLKSAISVDPVANTVVLPIHKGNLKGETVWYIITDSSDRDDAIQRGVVYSPLLAEVGVVQNVILRKGGTPLFTGAPNFSPTRVFMPGKTGFPPAAAKPGANADASYSPFIRINEGSTILNAPIIATGNGPFDVTTHTNTEDRVLAIDTRRKTVTLLLVHGFAEGRPVLYISTEASDPGVATVERATYVPSLAKASAKIPILVLANGQTGVGNPQAQGLGFAALDTHLNQEATLQRAPTQFSPRNILTAFPIGKTANAYTPLWDASLGVWSAPLVAKKQNVLQKDQAGFNALVAQHRITGPGGKPFGPIGVLVNCPVIAYVDAAP